MKLDGNTQLFLPPPPRAFSNHIAFTYTPFTGQAVIDTALFIENRTVRELFLYDLNYFESNPTTNFVICTNSHVAQYKAFLNLFNLKVNLYTSEEVKRVNTYIPYVDTINFNDRWRMKHRGLITSPLSFKKIILYSHTEHTDHAVYEYSNIKQWLDEGFIFVNTSTTPMGMLINVIAGADIVICASEIDLFYTTYCKYGSTVFFIAQEHHHPRYTYTINKRYDTSEQFYNMKLLLRENTFDEYKSITSCE